MKTNLQYIPHEGSFSCCEPQGKINTRSIFFLISQTTTPKKSNSEQLLSYQTISWGDAQRHGHTHAVTTAVCQVANIPVSSHYEEVYRNSKHAAPHDNTHMNSVYRFCKSNATPAGEEYWQWQPK